MECEIHNVKVEYLSIHPSCFGKLICIQCIQEGELFKTENNYFYIENIKNGKLFSKLEKEINSVNRSSFELYENTLQQQVSQAFDKIMEEMRAMKIKIHNIIIKNNFTSQLSSLIERLEELKASSFLDLSRLFSDKQYREKLSNHLSYLINGIQRINSKDNSVQAAQKLSYIPTQINDLLEKMRNITSQIEESFLNPTVVNLSTIYPNTGVCNISVTMNELKSISEEEVNNESTTKKFPIKYSLQRSCIVNDKNDSPVVFTSCLEEKKGLHLSLWDPVKFKPLKYYKNIEKHDYPYLISLKKRYLVLLKDYDNNEFTYSNCICIFRLTSKGFKRIVQLKIKMSSFFEFVDKSNTLIVGEKLGLFVWSIHQRKMLQKLILTETIYLLRVIEEMNLLLIGGTRIRGYELVNGLIGELKFELEDCQATLIHLQADHTRNIIYTFYTDGMMRIWKVGRNGGSLIRGIKTDLYPSEIYIFPENRICIERSSDDSLNIYSLEDSRLLGNLRSYRKFLAVVTNKNKKILLLEDSFMMVYKELTL